MFNVKRKIGNLNTAGSAYHQNKHKRKIHKYLWFFVVVENFFKMNLNSNGLSFCSFQMIETSKELEALVERLKLEDSIGVDMEFMTSRWDAGTKFYDKSCRYDPPRLCLIQISTRDGEVFLIDTLLGLDLASFWLLMSNEHVAKIVHDGKEEVSRCREHSETAPKNLFDLQIACCLVGSWCDGVLELRPSLQTLVKKHANVLLDKTCQRSDWERRPLSVEQLEYAANDVRFLFALRDHFEALLRVKGRETLSACFVSECESLCERKSKVPKVFELLGRQEWSVKQYGNLLGLLEWRKAKARALKLNKEKKVLSDVELVSRARNASNDELIRFCENGFRRVLVMDGIKAETPEEYLENDLCFSLCKAMCLSHGIYPEVVPSGGRFGYEFVHLIRYLRKHERFPESCFLSTGWRFELIGKPLLDFVCHKKPISFVKKSE